MRTGKLIAVFLTLALLTACGGTVGDRDREAFLAIRTALLARESLTLRADLRADYGDRVYDYVLSYAGSGEGGTLRIEEPLELEGIEAVLGDKGVTLRYDGFMLDTGAILGELSPLEAFPLLIRCWRSGFVTDCWRETWNGEACLTAQFDLTEAGAAEERLCVSRFRLSDGAPLEAELLADGRTVLLCRFIE